MATTNQKIQIYAGNYRLVTLTLTDQDGVLIPEATLNAGRVIWRCATSVTKRDDPFLSKDTAEADLNKKITVVGPGLVQFELHPEETDAIPRDKTFYADVLYIDGDGKPDTVSVGSLEVKAALVHAPV